MSAILVVDDEELVRGLVRAVLEAEGFHVLEAAGAEEALEAARSPVAVDLVVTDVCMPRIRGTELVPLLRARRPGLRALYMSGNPGEAAGQAWPLLQKPFTPAALVDAVRAALAETRAA